MIYILVQKITPRLRYIITTLFEERLGLRVQLTDNPAITLNTGDAGVSYGMVHKAMLSIPAQGLLFSDAIVSLNPVVERADGESMIFRCGGEGYDTPFDLFSAIFFLLSRYEEYLPFEPDIHGRFASHNAWSVGLSLECVPLADRWLLYLERLLNSRFPGLPITKASYRFLPTIDIDNAWAFKHKTLWRQAGGTARSLLRWDIEAVRRRISVVIAGTRDPFDTYDSIFTMNSAARSPLFFLLMSNKGTNNHNLSPQNRHWQQQIRSLASVTEVGIHPSYEAFLDEEAMKQEIDTLEAITGKKITSSRQHFLRLSLPITYRILSRCGIREDYSLGFADRIGFRAGTTHPFRFFDLEANCETGLMLYPLTIMDGTLLDYMQLSPQKAIEKITLLAENTRRHHGTFVSLWHNESLGEYRRWKGWREVYRKMNELCKE
ncbi:MAG: polysaccharide deacetylase family protein [Bacteroidales bacterium]|nr:polysaccharide deacetylase family protein [Bacteroidales bacterium]